MSTESQVVVAELCADLISASFARGRGLGVFVEHLPALDPGVLLERLASQKPPPRVALLGIKAVKAPKGLELTFDPTLANEWRNTATKGSPPTAVVVLGPASKVNSLRSALTLVGPGDLRRALSRQAIDRLPTDDRRFFWAAIERSTAITLDRLLAFCAATKSASKSALLDVEREAVHHLGLLRQEALTMAGGPAKARSALLQNLELVDRLRDLSLRDRRVLAAVDDNQANGVVGRILQFCSTKGLEALDALTFEEVKRALQPPKKKDDVRAVTAPKALLEGDSLALELMLAGGHGLGVAAKRFAKEIEPDSDGEIDADEITVGNRTIALRLRAGTSQAVAGIIAGLCTETIWGGVITAERAPDIVAALKLSIDINADRKPFEPNAEGGVREILAKATKSGIAPASALKAWDRYAEQRAQLLPYAAALADHPMLAIGGQPSVRAAVVGVLEAYGAALAAVQAAADALKAVSGEAAKRLRAKAACVDVVFVQLQEDISAIAAPTHPFHLWRWLTLHDLIKGNLDEFNALGFETLEGLVSDPPTVAPHLVLSTFALDGISKTRSLVAVGSFGALPLFAEPGSKQAVRFRSRALEHVAKRLLRVMPHASLGLQVVLVDPPSVAGALEHMVELKSTLDGETLVPLHVTIVRTRAVGDPTEEEELTLELIARDLQEARGTLAVAPNCKSLRDVAAQLRGAPMHLCVVFDPGEGKDLKLGVSTPPLLSPLVLPRAYTYDQFDDRLDVVIAGTAPEFDSYQKLFCELTDTPRGDFLGRRSGASRVSRELEALALSTVWLTVIDQGLEPTLAVKGADRIDTWMDAGRDVITFSAHTEVVEQLVADAVRQVGLVADEETVKRTMRELRQLSGEALLWLAREKVSVDAADPRVAKGLMGVIAAVRWYLHLHPDALVVSLDDPLSRRWILGAGHDDRHGDLLFVRETKGGIAIEAVEVKAYDEGTAVLRAMGGVVEGRAVGQVEQTLAILKRVLAAKPASMVDLARQAILRDQLYRAVAGRPYVPERRRRFVNILESLFADGAVEFTGLIVKVMVESGGGHQTPSAPKYSKGAGGDRIGYAELIETEVGPRVGGGEARGKKPSQGALKGSTTVSPEDTPPQAKAELVTATAAKGSAVSVRIGKAPDGTDVVWAPGRAENPLNNFGLMVTGDSGAGKTQILRAVIDDVVRAGLPVCVFDFKNDYSSKEFAGALGLRVHDVDTRGLPFNPLALIGDADGLAQPIRLIHEVVGIVKRIFDLGEQQEARLRQGVQAAFEQSGIDPKARSKVAGLPKAPAFNDVFEALKQDLKRNEALLNRLSPLFDLDLFPSSDAATSFEDLLREGVVLDLHALPNDEIKAALAEFLIVRIHTHLLKGAQPRELRRLLVLDEAWRVARSERLEELAREGRAFGVGLAIGTQFPGDLPDTLAGSLASQLLLQNSDPDHRKAVARTLCGSASGAQALAITRRIDHLKKHEGFFRNQHYAPYTLVETLPHWQRVVPVAS